MLFSTFTALSFVASLSSLPVAISADPWADTYGGFPDPAFAGVATFAHLDHQRCLDNPDLALDLAIIGIPYDSAVTFRPGECPVICKFFATNECRWLRCAIRSLWSEEW
jgi:hypothetical protein